MENNDPSLPKKEKPKPLTDDFYWFQVAKDLVDKGPERIGESAGKFEELLKWLWGIYTPLIGLGGSALAIYLNVQYTFFTILLLVLPSFLLLLGYWAATMAKSAVVVSFEQNEIASIKNAYNQTVEVRRHYYQLAQLFTLFACTLIPIAILISHAGQKSKINFTASLHSNQKCIILSGEFPGKEEVKISYLNKSSEPIKTFGKSSFIYKEICLNEEELKNSSIEVYAEYTEDDGKIRIVREIKIKP